MFESFIGKIPLVRPIYAGSSNWLMHLILMIKTALNMWCLIEFPRKGMYTIGFMTSEISAALSPDPQNVYYNVFVPATPNPTSGFYFMVAKDQVIIISLSRQEAMALIMSGGIIQPDRFINKEGPKF